MSVKKDSGIAGLACLAAVLSLVAGLLYSTPKSILSIERGLGLPSLAHHWRLPKVPPNRSSGTNHVRLAGSGCNERVRRGQGLSWRLYGFVRQPNQILQKMQRHVSIDRTIYISGTAAIRFRKPPLGASASCRHLMIWREVKVDGLRSTSASHPSLNSSR